MVIWITDSELTSQRFRNIQLSKVHHKC